MDKITLLNAKTEEDWEFLRGRNRAQEYLIRMEKELFKNGPDEETEWFINYVWEMVYGIIE